MLIDDPLQVVASAVTPVVLVSATAILIGGVNSRHISISDRIRSLTAEYRNPGTTLRDATELPSNYPCSAFASNSLPGRFAGCILRPAALSRWRC